IARRRMKADDLLAAVDDCGRHLDALAARDCCDRAAVRPDAPQMPTIYVVLVRGEDDRVVVRRISDVLDFVVAGREQHSVAAARRDRIEMPPAVALGVEDDAVMPGPTEKFVRRQTGV